MEEEGSRSDWSADDYEKRIKELITNKAALEAKDEEQKQMLFTLKRQMQAKNEMEKDYLVEIADLNAIIDKLHIEGAEKTAKLTGVQRSLDLVKMKMEEDKEGPVASPQQIMPLKQNVREPSPQPGVSQDEHQALMDRYEKLQVTFEDTVVKLHNLEATNENLVEDIEASKTEAAALTVACDNAKKAYSEVMEVLNEYKSQLSNAHEELVLLSEQPMQPGARGNSLFSEVDDNRKEVAQRFIDLKGKYLALTAKYRRNTVNTSMFAAEKASLRRLIEEVDTLLDNVATAELESLRQRIRLQDKIIKELKLNEVPIPIHVIGVLGSTEMRYIEEIISGLKRSERSLLLQLDESSKANLLMQDQIIELQTSLASANSRIVKEVARNRIYYLDNAMADAEAAAAKALAEPMDFAGPSGISKAASEAPDEMTQINVPKILEIHPQAMGMPTLAMSTTTISGSARTPTFGPSHGTRGILKRRASTDNASFPDSGPSGVSCNRCEHQSDPAGLGSPKRRLRCQEAREDEVQTATPKRRRVHFMEDLPEPKKVLVEGLSGQPPPQLQLKASVESVVEPEVQKDSSKSCVASVHIPSRKRKSVACTRKKRGNL